MKNDFDMRRMAELYRSGHNIMEFLRSSGGINGNSVDSILVSYDLQAGSYTKNVEQSEYGVFMEGFSAAVAKVFDGLPHGSLLEAGVGEATTLANVAARLAAASRRVYGFDISWSRLHYASCYAAKKDVPATFFVGNLLDIPVLDDAFSLVYTSDSIEPNTGKEEVILRELYRIAKNYVVLLEPSYELGSGRTKQHIEKHGYVRDLYATAKRLGYKVVEWRLFEPCFNPNSQTALMVIEKDPNPADTPEEPLACPVCKAKTASLGGHIFCGKCGLIFPVIAGIPCLLPEKGVLGGKFPEACGQDGPLGGAG